MCIHSVWFKSFANDSECIQSGIYIKFIVHSCMGTDRINHIVKALVLSTLVCSCIDTYLNPAAL